MRSRTYAATITNHVRPRTALPRPSTSAVSGASFRNDPSHGEGDPRSRYTLRATTFRSGLPTFYGSPGLVEGGGTCTLHLPPHSAGWDEPRRWDQNSSEFSIPFDGIDGLLRLWARMMRRLLQVHSLRPLGRDHLNASPTIGRPSRGADAVGQASCERSPRISRCSHALASRQSRMTVSGDTFSTDAVSSTLNPPKNRSSTTRLFRSSNCRQRLQRVVERHEVLTRLVGDDERLVEGDPHRVAAALLSARARA